MINGYGDVFPKRNFWRNISEKYKGKFSIKHTSSYVHETLKLILPIYHISLEITESDTKPLKFYFETKFNKQFEFNIYKEDGIDKFLKLLGKKEIDVNNEEFNKKHFLQSNNINLFKKLFNDPELTAFIKKYNIYSFVCKYNNKTKMHEFKSVINFGINDEDSLEEIIQIHFSIISKLKKLNLFT